MTGEFSGRVALVTGAAGAGIGQATARRLAREGAAVAITDSHERRTKEVAESLRAEYGDRIVGYTLDISDRARADEVLAQAETDLGPLDFLVNNAAINLLGPLSEYEPADWDRVIDVDLNANFYLIRRALPGMMERKRGVIVNVSSVAGWLTGGGVEGPYAAAKAAMMALTRTVAFEGGPFGVRCNAVAPGIVRSRFVEKRAEAFEREIQRTPLRRLGEPEDIANIIAFLCSEQSSFVTGETINASGGWYMRG
ncbi:MAG: SDR family NAD(P)-dependent oxidoreductase [Myxococcota bacterium]|nr:SDR family NAD(P)-dependent oxidoreductase [Myxococcota bacterium]